MLKPTESSSIGMDNLQSPADTQDAFPLNEELGIDSAVFNHQQPLPSDLLLPMQT